MQYFIDDYFDFMVQYFDNKTINLLAQTSTLFRKHKKKHYIYKLNKMTSINFCNDEHFRNQFIDCKKVYVVLKSCVINNTDIFKNVSKLSLMESHINCEIDFSNIKELVLVKCTNIKNIKNAHNVQKILVYDCNDFININLNETTIKNLVICNCNNLTELKIPNTVKKLYLKHCLKLKTIDSDYKNIKFLKLTGLPKITSFNFNECTFVTLTLTNMYNLKKINIYKCKDLTTLILNECIQLKYIDTLETNNIINLDLTKCYNICKINKFISNLKNLECVLLNHCNIINVNGFEHVKSLDLCYCSNIENIDNLINIEFLDLTGCYKIKNINKLIDINIKDINLNNSTQIKNKNLSYKIKFLTIKYCFGLKNYDELTHTEKKCLENLETLRLIKEQFLLS